MTGQSEGTGGAPPQDRSEDRPFAPEKAAEDRAAGTAASSSADKAEPEKAKTEIDAGDVADDLADFA